MRTTIGFVYIPAGTYMRGSPEDEPCRDSNETQHQVVLTRPFLMMRTEMTRQMWADLKAAQPTLPVDKSWLAFSPTMDHPIHEARWFEAVLFANLMSLRDGYTQCYYLDEGFTEPVDATNYITDSIFCNFLANGYRLPTEAEWEYACRAGTTGPFSFDEPNYNTGTCESCIEGTLPELEKYCVYCLHDRPEVAGSMLANPWGLYNMHGNVWEWCWDKMGSYPRGTVTDPTGPQYGSRYRVVRGGGWHFQAKSCRSAKRHDTIAGYWGFRLVRTAN
ncbi:MAG: formylglycine-generating enzyme family protein [bacterium]